MSLRFSNQGLTLVELLISLSIAAMLLVGVHQLVGLGFDSKEEIDRSTQLARDARFAMTRMVAAVSAGERLLIPQSDNPSTSLNESVREQTINAGSSSGSAVLAVTLDPQWDYDGDGIKDADNDGDGRVDEDLPADTTNDGEPGIGGFDDDGNGSSDYWFSPAGDDDESNNLKQSEDPINGFDDDGDGSVDEDPGADNNNDGAPGVAGVDDDGDGQTDEGDVGDDDEDGMVDEDWYDPVVFYLVDSSLVERRAVPWDQNSDGSVSGEDYVEAVVVENVKFLRFERVTQGLWQDQLVRISLEIVNSQGESFAIDTQVRLDAHQ